MRILRASVTTKYTFYSASFDLYLKSLLEGDAVDLYQRTHRECSYLIADTRRLIAGEVLSIYSVHSAEVSDVGEENGGLSYIVIRLACLLKDVAKVVERLTSLSLNALCHLAGSAIDGELTRDIDGVVRGDSL